MLLLFAAVMGFFSLVKVTAHTISSFKIGSGIKKTIAQSTDKDDVRTKKVLASYTDKASKLKAKALFSPPPPMTLRTLPGWFQATSETTFAKYTPSSSPSVGPNTSEEYEPSAATEHLEVPRVSSHTWS